MMGRRIPLTRAEEYDALTRARRFYCWTQRAGAVAAVKRRYRRRERRVARAQLREELLVPNGDQGSPYKCTICGDTFDTAAELYGHRTTAHPDADR